jgi:hypothetical protein
MEALRLHINSMHCDRDVKTTAAGPHIPSARYNETFIDWLMSLIVNLFLHSIIPSFLQDNFDSSVVFIATMLLKSKEYLILTFS